MILLVNSITQKIPFQSINLYVLNNLTIIKRYLIFMRDSLGILEGCSKY